MQVNKLYLYIGPFKISVLEILMQEI